MSQFTDEELTLYLSEELDAQTMLDIEASLRTDRKLLQRLESLRASLAPENHSLEAIWRRHRISCLSRDDLGLFLLGALDEEHANYVRFHLGEIGCRWCQANLSDLKTLEASQEDPQIDRRRRRYFETSAGYLGGT